MSKVSDIKAEIFDILREQQTLQLQVQALEQTKNEKLKELALAENPPAKADAKTE